MTKHEKPRLRTDKDGMKDLCAQASALDREIRETCFRVRAEADAREALHEDARRALQESLDEVRAVLDEFGRTKTLRVDLLEAALDNGRVRTNCLAGRVEDLRQEFTVQPLDPDLVHDDVHRAIEEALRHPAAPGTPDNGEAPPAFLTEGRDNG